MLGSLRQLHAAVPPGYLSLQCVCCRSVQYVCNAVCAGRQSGTVCGKAAANKEAPKCNACCCLRVVHGAE